MSHAKDGRCGLSRNEDIRRYVGKLVEKQTLDRMPMLKLPMYLDRMSMLKLSMYLDYLGTEISVDL